MSEDTAASGELVKIDTFDEVIANAATAEPKSVVIIEGETPAGGSKAVLTYIDESECPVAKDDAAGVVIDEITEDGNLLDRTVEWF